MRAPVLVFGSNGQVAQALKALLPEAVFLSRTECDLERPGQAAAALEKHKPRVVINAAAYTEVDKAESENERSRAHQINAAAVQEIAFWCARNDVSLIHYSTDYVYPGDGDLPWSELAPVAPRNHYGQTKLDGEAAIRSAGCHHVILRTSWVFSPVGKNFVKTMLKLGLEREHLSVVDDQVGSPTYAPDIARATLRVLGHPHFAKGEASTICAIRAGSRGMPSPPRFSPRPPPKVGRSKSRAWMRSGPPNIRPRPSDR
ncbi:MAG: dTDP-4-dehydrorhamnose reductase [Calothrix sp. SM1_5_4]|nr:dTDP-4-dehydrorhamnose reductase [Calothrix sp. SM1_5_4]